MESAKEVTINYLKSIRDDRLGAYTVCRDELDNIGLIIEMSVLEGAIRIVKESEGE